MSSLFTHVLGVLQNTYVVSNTITTNFGDNTPVSVLSGNGILYKNGVEVGISTTVSNGDMLYIRSLSATTFNSATHNTISIGTQIHTFTSITTEDPAALLYPPFIDILPTDLTVQQDGSTWTPDSTNNYLAEYTNTGNIASTIPITTVSSTVATTNACIVVADYFSDTITIIDSVTKQIVKTVSLPAGSHPHSVTYTQVSAADARSMAWVTLAGTNQVVCIGPDRTIINTFATGIKPLGIAASPDGNTVYVANNGTNTVSKFTYNGSAWSSSDIVVENAPFGVAVDVNNSVWITCSTGTKLYKLTSVGALTSYEIGAGLRGITSYVSGNSIYVTVSRSNTIIKVDINTGTIVKTYNIPGIMPYDVCVTTSGTVYASCFASKQLVQISQSGVTGIYNTGAYPYGIVANGDNVFVASYYDNTPSYVQEVDRTPDTITFVPITDAPYNTLTTTENITISGISVATPISIPAVYGAQLFVDGVLATNTTTVTNGSVVYVKYTTPVSSSTMYTIPLYIGQYNTTITGTTLINTVGDLVPIVFDPIIINGVMTAYESSIGTISGLADGFSCSITSELGWQIRLNGVVESTADVVTVTNGDTITLVGMAQYESEIVLNVIVAGELFPFGLLSLQALTIDNGIKWEYVARDGEDNQYIVFDLDPTRSGAVDLPTQSWYSQLTTNVSQYDHTTYYTQQILTTEDVGFVINTNVSIVISEEDIIGIPVSQQLEKTAQLDGYDVAPSPHIITAVLPEVQSPTTYTNLLGEAAVYETVVFTTISVDPLIGEKSADYDYRVVEPVYVKSADTVQRLVEPVYIKNADTVQRTIRHVYEKNVDRVQRTAEPMYEKNVDRIQRTVKPIYEKNVVFSARMISHLYEKSIPADGIAVSPTYYATTHIQQHITDIYGVVYEPAVAREQRTTALALYTVEGSRKEELFIVPVEGVVVSQVTRTIDPLLPEKLYIVHQDYDDSYEQQGLYATAMEAMEAGELAGHNIVNVIEMPGGGFMWNYNIAIPTVGCDGEDLTQSPNGIAKPHKWYVHGG